MIIWGINALNHDASIAVFNGYRLLEHHRSSEFSGIPNDSNLDKKLITHCFKIGYPSAVFWYERPWLKKTRQLRAGQWSAAFDLNDLPHLYLRKQYIRAPIYYAGHHHSHAAAGYYTSPFSEAAVVVLDAIGEWETCSIWHGVGDNLKRVWSRRYPTSIGLFYSAFTDLIGLTAVQDEFKLQQLSEQGDSNKYYSTVANYFSPNTKMKYNLHQGVTNWPWGFDLTSQDQADIAAAVQRVFEEQVDLVMLKARQLTGCQNLVYMGGCAYNSKYNTQLSNQWDRIHSIEFPGDSGSSIGAVLAYSKHRISLSGKTKHITIK